MMFVLVAQPTNDNERHWKVETSPHLTPTEGGFWDILFIGLQDLE